MITLIWSTSLRFPVFPFPQLQNGWRDPDGLGALSYGFELPIRVLEAVNVPQI